MCKRWGRFFYVNQSIRALLRSQPSCRKLILSVSYGKLIKALGKFGFPVGPIKLLDDSGNRCSGTKNSFPNLQHSLSERFSAPEAYL